MSKIDIPALAEKEVRLKVVNDEGREVEIEGTIEAASAAGVVLRQKRARRSEVYAAHQILDAEVLVVGKRLKRRQLAPLEEGEARQHLIDRHGYKMEDIEQLSEEEALEFHAGIDHAPLGHSHRAPTPAEAAIAETEEELNEDDE